MRRLASLVLLLFCVDSSSVVNSAAEDDELLRAWRGSHLCKGAVPRTPGSATGIEMEELTIARDGVARTVFYALNKSGGGDSYDVVFESGPARVQPEIVDNCDGSYEMSARLLEAGNYSWKLRLQWEGNEGLDERLDPSWGEPLRQGEGLWLKEKWRVKVREEDVRIPRDSCEGYDHPSRYVDVPPRGRVGSVYEDLWKKHRDDVFGIEDPADTWLTNWRPIDCLLSPKKKKKAPLAGKTIVFLGDSTLRIFFANFLQLAMGVRIRSCGPDHVATQHPCMCHGSFLLRLPTTVASDTCASLECVSLEDIDRKVSSKEERPPFKNETLFVYAFTSFADCTSVNEYPDLLKKCEKVSGTKAQLLQSFKALLPAADVVVSNLGEHVTLRGGLPGCLRATRHWLPVIADLSRKAKGRFLLDSQPVPYTASEHLGEDTKAGVGIRKGNNARVRACNDLQRHLLSDDDHTKNSTLAKHWTFVSGRFDAAWLAPEWHEKNVHYIASPVVNTLKRAILDTFAS